MSESERRVVVIGGGALGVSTAAHLARQGGAEVVLVTQGAFADGASGRSLSWLNSSHQHSPAYHALRVEGMRRYRQFASRHDSSAYLQFTGNLFWPGEDGAAVEELHEHLTAVGYGAELLTPAEVERRGLGVDRAALPDQVLFTPEDGWVDLGSLISALLEDFAAAGGVAREHAGAARVEVEGDRVTGVSFADGARIAADAVVLATGPAVPPMLREAGLEMPDQTSMAALVRTEPVDHGLHVVVNAPRVAVRPNVGGNLVLDRDWAAAHVDGDPEDGYRLPAPVVEELLEEVRRLLPGRPALRAASVGIGPKPIPGDGEPVLGEVDGIDGYFVAFTHSGATLALVAGELLACEVIGSPQDLLSAFRPGRFGGAASRSV